MQNNQERYSISEFAALVGVTTETLRYYHKAGLLYPSYVDPESGYRYYSLLEFEEIGVIQVLQALGLSLNAIKEISKNKTVFNSYQILSKQYDEISNKLKELTEFKIFLEEKLESMHDIMMDAKLGEIIMKELPTRIGHGNTKDCRTYEEIKITSAKIIQKYNKNLFISNAYALFVPKEELLKPELSNHYYCVILGIRREENEDVKELHFDRGTYATIQYNGTSFQRGPALKKLLSFIHENNYKILGDMLQICIIDENITNLDSEMVSELQIRVDS